MVVVDNYICSNCGYKYSNKAEIFYFNDDLTELEVTLKLALTLRNLSKSPLYGSAHEKYCPNCNEFVRTYTVYKNTNKYVIIFIIYVTVLMIDKNMKE